MKIILSAYYQNVNGVRIAPGEYEVTDPALHGLAQYLVDTGHAVALADEPAPEVEAAPIEVEPAPEPPRRKSKGAS